MHLRVAGSKDLQKLKAMYTTVVEQMHKSNLFIWDEIYPCAFLSEDIEKHRLYVLADEQQNIAAAFALCEENAGKNYVQWQNAHGKALYLDRLAVHVDYARRGLGSMALRQAAVLARQHNAVWLRLFVVDINQPAINLYLKNGFQQASGVYEEKIEDDLVLQEFGFEIEVSKAVSAVV